MGEVVPHSAIYGHRRGEKEKLQEPRSTWAGQDTSSIKNAIYGHMLGGDSEDWEKATLRLG